MKERGNAKKGVQKKKKKKKKREQQTIERGGKRMEC